MKKILTLCIIHQGDRVLLGMKKRGHGEGKWNGFGGKVQEGETIEEAAMREMREEADIVPEDMVELAVIDFEEVGKEDVLEVHLFKATRFSGEPTESEEMRPQWFSVDEVPFDKMWLDDRYWFPYLLDGVAFDGRFLFQDPSTLIEHQIHLRKQ